MEQNTNDSVNCARVFITCKYCMRLFGDKGHIFASPRVFLEVISIVYCI